MVDIVNFCIGVGEFYQILDNLNHILLRKRLHIHIGGKTKLTVNTIAAYFTQIIALLREEEVEDYLTSRSIICRLSVAKLAIDEEHCFLLRTSRVFLESVEDD